MSDRAPDVYGRRRRPWGAGLALAAIVLISVLLGIFIGRATAPNTAPTPASGHPDTSGVPGVGPNAVANGIPVGYEHSARGAAQAAGNYLSILGGQLVLDPVRLRAALDQVAEPSSRSRLEQGLSSGVDAEEALWGIRTAASQGKRVLLTQTPIAYRVDSYSPEEAAVSVWQVVNVGVEGRQRLTAFYGIGSATLVWLNGDWRLRNIDAGNQTGDVVPVSLQTPTQTGGVPAKLDGFVPYGG